MSEVPWGGSFLGEGRKWGWNSTGTGEEGNQSGNRQESHPGT